MSDAYERERQLAAAWARACDERDAANAEAAQHLEHVVALMLERAAARDERDRLLATNADLATRLTEALAALEIERRYPCEACTAREAARADAAEAERDEARAALVEAGRHAQRHCAKWCGVGPWTFDGERPCTCGVEVRP